MTQPQLPPDWVSAPEDQGTPDATPEKVRAIELTDYIKSFEIPDYLVERLIITGRVYSLTAATGHGKTAWATYAALCVACGAPLAGLETKKGKVLYLSGENDEDQKARTIATMQAFGLNPEPGYFHVISGGKVVGAMMEDIHDINEERGPFAFIVVDTSAAYYGGKEDNSNTDQQMHAGFFRALTRMAGSPTLLVLCHPVKSADRTNLLPRGGGAFLNAVDGNLTLWKSGERATLHHHGKFRGPSFDPIDFALKMVVLNGYKDSKGRPIDSVVLDPISEAALIQLLHKEWTDENRVLHALLHHPNKSVRDYCEICYFTGKTGQPQTSKLAGILSDLSLHGLVTTNRMRKWELTKKGKEEAEKVGDDEDLNR